jgi:Ca2+:H+ antiporter
MLVAPQRRIFRDRPQEKAPVLQPLLKEIRQTPLLWMLVFVPAVLVAEAVVPLAALLSHATEAVAAKTGDAVGGLLNPPWATSQS